LAGDGDVFVESFPVEFAAPDAELFALLRCGAEEAGKPGEGYVECASVAEVDLDVVGVEADWPDRKIHFRRDSLNAIIVSQVSNTRPFDCAQGRLWGTHIGS
jgi:hypothetical protein